MEGQTLIIWTLVTVVWCGTLPDTNSQAFTLDIPVETVYPELVPLYTRSSTGDNYVYSFHFSNHWATTLFNYFCNESQQVAQIVSRDRLTQSVNDIELPPFDSVTASDYVIACLVGNDTLLCSKVNSELLASLPEFRDYQCQETLPIESEELCKAMHIVWRRDHYDHLHNKIIDGVTTPNVYRQGCIILDPVISTTADPIPTVFPAMTTTFEATSTAEGGQEIPGPSTVKTPTAKMSTWIEFITSSTIPQHKTTTTFTTTESAGDATSSTIPTPTEGMTCTQMDSLKEIWQLQQLIQGRMSLINQYVQDVSGWQLEIQNHLRLIPSLAED